MDRRDVTNETILPANDHRTFKRTRRGRRRRVRAAFVLSRRRSSYLVAVTRTGKRARQAHANDTTPRRNTYYIYTHARARTLCDDNLYSISRACREKTAKTSTVRFSLPEVGRRTRESVRATLLRQRIGRRTTGRESISKTYDEWPNCCSCLSPSRRLLVDNFVHRRPAVPWRATMSYGGLFVFR